MNTPITLLSAASDSFLPGFYGLYNSARANGFDGQCLFLQTQGRPSKIQHEGLTIHQLPKSKQSAHPYLARLHVLKDLPDGEYLFVDSDWIIERPMGHLLEAIQTGLLLSLEPQPKLSPFDARLVPMCGRLGIDPRGLPDFPYVNSGLIGFSLPRDRAFIEGYVHQSLALFAKSAGVFKDRDFPMMEQDVLNVLVRDAIRSGRPIWTLGERVVEFGNWPALFFDRPFPASHQSRLEPKDQLKYFIHGSALERPWIIKGARSHCISSSANLYLKTLGLWPWLRRMKGKLYPYERAWVHYACSNHYAIKMNEWIEDWPELKEALSHKLWRAAYK